jgi:predicted GNAT family N-acyltransferase
MKILFNSDLYRSSLAIRREVFIHEQKVPEEIEIDEFESSCDHFLIYKENLPAATGRLRVKKSFIKFERIATLKKFREMGLASILIAEMTNYAHDHYSQLTPYMHAQLDVVPFYEKLGWVAEDEVFFEAGIPHRIMKSMLR